MNNLLLAGALLVTAGSANAAVITVNGSFTASNWRLAFGAPGTPLDPLFLDYSVTFDTALTYANSAAPLTIFRTNIPYEIRFSRAANFGLYVLATNGAPFGCGLPDNSFCAFVGDTVTGVPTAVSQSGVGSVWSAGTIVAGTPAIPEPMSWTMLIAGFGLVGGVARRRRAVVAA